MREKPMPVTMQKPVVKEALGERLYSEVEKYEPEEASKITGMLLEMQIDQIHSMLKDNKQLKQWVSEAKQVLNSSSNQ